MTAYTHQEGAFHVAWEQAVVELGVWGGMYDLAYWETDRLAYPTVAQVRRAYNQRY